MRFGPLDIQLRRNAPSSRNVSAKSSLTWRPLTAIFGARQPVWTPRDYHSFAREGYGKNVYVYRCVNLIADACAGIPWKLYRKQSGGDRAEVNEGEPGYELLRLLQKPNDEEGGGTFIQAVVGYLQLSGNSYIERVGPNGNRPPRELYALRPDRMQVIPGDRLNPVRGYEYRVNGRVMSPDFTPEQILHVKLWNPLSDWYGMSPMEAAAQSTDQNNGYRSWNTGLLQNSARPPGVFALKDGQELSDDEWEELQGTIREHYAGPDNAGRQLLLGAGADWKATAYAPAEMDWTGGTRLSAMEIALAYNVPPGLIGDPDSKSYANRTEDRKSLYTETALPLMDTLRDEFNTRLSPLFDDRLELDYDRDDIEALREDQTEVWNRANGALHITINEKRAMTGQPPLPGGDVLVVPNTMQILPADEADLPALSQSLTAPKPPISATISTEKARALSEFKEKAAARRLGHERKALSDGHSG